jgi:hypothetical protein
MALSIKDPEAEQLARNLARQTGETTTQAVIVALRERLAREQRKIQASALVKRFLLAAGESDVERLKREERALRARWHLSRRRSHVAGGRTSTRLMSKLRFIGDA